MLEFADELCEFIESCKRLEICLVEETYQYFFYNTNRKCLQG